MAIDAKLVRSRKKGLLEKSDALRSFHLSPNMGDTRIRGCEPAMRGKANEQDDERLHTSWLPSWFGQVVAQLCAFGQTNP